MYRFPPVRCHVLYKSCDSLIRHLNWFNLDFIQSNSGILDGFPVFSASTKQYGSRSVSVWRNHFFLWYVFWIFHTLYNQFHWPNSPLCIYTPHLSLALHQLPCCFYRALSFITFWIPLWFIAFVICLRGVSVSTTLKTFRTTSNRIIF